MILYSLGGGRWDLGPQRSPIVCGGTLWGGDRLSGILGEGGDGTLGHKDPPLVGGVKLVLSWGEG